MLHILEHTPRWAWQKLQRWLGHPRFAWQLAGIAIVLSSSALLLDLYLDEQVARYIYSGRAGAARLFKNHCGGFGYALGIPEENHWLMEEGWAPWWLDEHLRFAGFRPLSVLSHMLDFRVLGGSPVWTHLHSLLWAGLMVLAVTRMYGAAMSPAVAAAAALLFTLDHTHGFAVGYVMNRHAIMGATLGALTLTSYFRWRRDGSRREAWLSVVFYGLGLLTSELVISVFGYIVAFEWLERQDAYRRRLLMLAPYTLLTAVWLALYKAAGFGAAHTGFYIDPGREPWHFLQAFVVRAPLLLLGQFSGPPAELYYELPSALADGMLVWAVIVVTAVAWLLWPLLRRSRSARVWCVGLLGCLLPAAGPDANDRQLIFASFGAMVLLAQAWEGYAQGILAGKSGVGGVLAALFLAFRLVVSPALMPLMTLSIGLSGTTNTVAAAFLAEPYSGRDVIFVTAPYVYQVRVVQLFMRMSDKPLPRHIRYIGVGPRALRVERTGARTLEATFEGGLFSSSELRPERDLTQPLPPGTQVKLEAFAVEVLEEREGVGPTRARFTFDRSLDDPELAFYRWDSRRFVPFTPPALGEAVTLPGAVGPGGFE